MRSENPDLDAAGSRAATRADLAVIGDRVAAIEDRVAAIEDRLIGALVSVVTVSIETTPGCPSLLSCLQVVSLTLLLSAVSTTTMVVAMTTVALAVARVLERSQQSQRNPGSRGSTSLWLRRRLGIGW